MSDMTRPIQGQSGLEAFRLKPQNLQLSESNLRTCRGPILLLGAVWTVECYMQDILSKLRTPPNQQP